MALDRQAELFLNTLGTFDMIPEMILMILFIMLFFFVDYGMIWVAAL